MADFELGYVVADKVVILKLESIALADLVSSTLLK
jgi:hypothetical protein